MSEDRKPALPSPPPPAPLTDAEIDAALAICEAATAGPWEVDRDADRPGRCLGITLAHNHSHDIECWDVVDCPAQETAIVVTDSGVYPPKLPDADFIAAARTGYPRALRELREARARVASLEERVCDFQASALIDVGDQGGPCLVEPRHIEKHVTELRSQVDSAAAERALWSRLYGALTGAAEGEQPAYSLADLERVVENVRQADVRHARKVDLESKRREALKDARLAAAEECVPWASAVCPVQVSAWRAAKAAHEAATAKDGGAGK